MAGDDAVHRSICCRRQLSADSRRSNGKPRSGSLTLSLMAFAAWLNPVTTCFPYWNGYILE